MTHDFYDLLDVPEDAPQEDIKEAFRSRVQEVHPDLNDDPRAPAQFTALKKGYDTLNDPVERKAYDRLGHKDYVAKRLEGLPDPDQWKPADSGGDGTEETTTGSTSATSTSGSTSTASPGAGGSTGSSGSGRSTTASSAGTTAGTTRTTTGAASSTSTTGTTGASTGTSSDASTSTRTNARTNTGSATGTTGASTRTGGATASGTATGTATGSTTGTATGPDDATDRPGLIERLRSINYGWPLVFLTTIVYVAGIALYAREHVAVLQEFAAQVRASGADVAALRGALLAEGYGFTPVFEFVRTTALVGNRPGAGALIAAGAVLMPLIIFVVVRTTRKAFAWQPTYLYVVAVLAPVAGLAANAAGVDRPGLTVVAFGVLPLCAVVALPFNAFVTPRLKRLL